MRRLPPWLVVTVLTGCAFPLLATAAKRQHPLPNPRILGVYMVAYGKLLGTRTMSLGVAYVIRLVSWCMEIAAFP